MKKGITHCLALLSVLFFAGNLLAQEETVLDPVTVTSSLIEKRSSETGRNITIIRGETFSKLPVHSLDELLKYVPGIEVQSRGPQGSQSDISMRGGTFQQVLIILDGLRLNDPNTGHFSAYIPITPAEIERIEVLKGASSALYGSDAVGGVINIITKAFNALHKKDTQTMSGSFSAGTYGLVNSSLGGYYQKNKIALGAGFLSNHATGMQQRGTNGFFHNNAASAGMNYRLSRHWNISWRSAWDSRNFSAQNFYTSFVSDTATEKVSSWWHQARISYSKDRSRLTVDAGYKTLADRYAYNRGAAPNQNQSKLFQSLFSWQQLLSRQSSLVAGLHFQNREITSNDRGNHSLRIAAPFASLLQSVGEHITLHPSMRVEFIGSHAAEFIPQLNISAKLKALQLRASGGKTIRDADFTERYNNYNKEIMKSGSVGYPGLMAERSWSYEGGFDWFHGDRFKMSSTVFQRFHTGLIDWVQTSYANMPRKDNLVPAGVYALAQNIARVNTSGWETDLRYQYRPDEKRSVLINGGFVWLYSNSGNGQPSFYISSHARFLGNFMVLYEQGPVSLSFTGIYKNRKAQQASALLASVTKDYFLMNARASFLLVKKQLSAFVQADNIFDRKYSDLLGSPMPGRWMQGGISFNLVKD